MANRTYRQHARKPADTLGDLGAETRPNWRAVKIRLRQGHFEHQNTGRIETGVDAHESDEALDHEAGRDKNYEGKCDFNGDECGTNSCEPAGRIAITSDLEIR